MAASNCASDSAGVGPRRAGPSPRAVESPYGFFYPLDRIANWNRLYGRRGFTQYQCAIPESRGVDGVHKVFDLLGRRRAPVFLCVIKNCGDEGRGLLSFPLRGMSLALDLPVCEGIQELIDALNGLVIDLGGRIYVAKDAFTRPEHFPAEALIVRGGLLAAFPLALVAAGVVDRDALRRLRARATTRGAPPPSEPGELE